MQTISKIVTKIAAYTTLSKNMIQIAFSMWRPIAEYLRMTRIGLIAIGHKRYIYGTYQKNSKWRFAGIYDNNIIRYLISGIRVTENLNLIINIKGGGTIIEQIYANVK